MPSAHPMHEGRRPPLAPHFQGLKTCPIVGTVGLQGSKVRPSKRKDTDKRRLTLTYLREECDPAQRNIRLTNRMLDLQGQVRGGLCHGQAGRREGVHVARLRAYVYARVCYCLCACMHACVAPVRICTCAACMTLCPQRLSSSTPQAAVLESRWLLPREGKAQFVLYGKFKDEKLAMAELPWEKVPDNSPLWRFFFREDKATHTDRAERIAFAQQLASQVRAARAIGPGQLMFGLGARKKPLSCRQCAKR